MRLEALVLLCQQGDILSGEGLVAFGGWEERQHEDDWEVDAFVPLPLDGLVDELEVPASFVVVLKEQPSKILANEAESRYWWAEASKEDEFKSVKTRLLLIIMYLAWIS